MWVLAVRDVLKGVGVVHIRHHLASPNPVVALAVVRRVPESQRKEHNHHDSETAEQDRKCEVVPGRVLIAEHLRSDGVSCCPADEVGGDDDGFLGLAGDVAGEEGEG